MNVRWILRTIACFTAAVFAIQARAAVFPSPSAASARVEITDTQGLLSWNPPGVTPARNALTVMFWMKITLPDTGGFQLTEDMLIAGNRRTDWIQNHAYRFYFNYLTGNIEFTAKGSTATLPPVALVQRPYLDRWYHLAATRGSAGWSFYVDGRAVLPAQALPDIGNMNSTEGVSLGGFGTAQRFFGEIQEFAVLQRVLTPEQVNTNRLRDIPANLPDLRGYYKLGYSTAAADNLKNFASAPAAPLTLVPDAVKQGTGTIDFPETDKQGEQSYFDSQKNQGRDALSPLSGAFSWQRTIFSKPTAGIPFEFRIGCNSGISFNSEALQGDSTLYSRDNVLGPGWRHSFQTRLVPAEDFLPGAATPIDAQGRPIRFVGLLTWDGALETWQKNFQQPYKTVHGEYRGELIEDSSTDSMIWTTPERLIYVFDTPSIGGRLREIRDFNGNKVTCDYDGDGRLAKVTDSSRAAPAGEWIFTPDPATGKLLSVSSQGWTVTFAYTNDAPARLQSFSHRGPTAYEATPQVNTTWSFGYTQPGGAGSPFVVSSVATPRGPNDVTVDYDKYGRKTLERDGASRTTLFKYHTPGPRQISRTDGDGKVWIESFDRKGHVTAKTDPLGNAYRYEFYTLGETMTGGGAALVAGIMKKQTEPLGWVTLFDAYDDRGNLLQKTDALGRVWKWTFAKSTDPAGANGKLSERLPAGSTATPVTALLNRPLSDTRPRVVGEAADWTNRYAFDAYGNLLRHEDDIGVLASHAYDARGLVDSSKDAKGNETTYTYFPATGFPETRTTAAATPVAATARFTVTELGWVKSTTNALGETVTREFDINGNATRTTDAMGRFTTANYDEVGNLRFSTDAKGLQTELQYDGANLRIWTKDRAGNVAAAAYNGRSLLTDSASPQVPIFQSSGPPVSKSLISVRTYDDAGRLARAFDPHTGDPATVADRFTEQRYDANGNTIEAVDRLGKVWRKQYDRLNRVAVEIDPQGNTRTTSYDEAGRLLTVTSANGFTTRHEYDGRGRLKKWTDPEGSVWIYTYDGVGNILDIEDALHGHYVMTYDARNLRLNERNQDGLDWTYTYDALGRLKTQREPTGITRTLHYDPAGRLFYVLFSTGRQNHLSYDDNDNVTSLIRIESVGVSTFTTFGYDVLDRPTRSTDTFGQTVGYGYDALGRMTGLTYPGNRLLLQEFDLLSRLRRQKTGTNWGSHELTYDWDKEGRLTRMSYPNGIVRTADYTDTGWQKSLTYTDTKSTADPADDAIQIALNYAYDKNGNQTSAREKGLITYAPPAPHDETTAFTPAGRLQTRTDATDASGQKNWTYEFKNADGSPSFNLSRATCPSVGDLLQSYDEDNRVTEMAVIKPGGTLVNQRNRYDALGRRISRTTSNVVPGSLQNIVESRFVLSLTGGMERIFADTTATGTLTALYIHGPDLAVKVDPADPSKITCYHPDASGNIVRLTDQTRATVAQYAYSDYGRPFAATTTGTTDPNPYRFVGSQGVMEEPLLPGLYFMRARYYLADAGVFLSVDPVKNIGPGWKPEAYGYANGNPTSFSDANGQFAQQFFGGLVGGVVGGVVGAVSETINQTASWATGGGFHADQILHKSAEGIVSGAVTGATGSSVAGGAAGEVYGDYIQALERGEDYDLKDGLTSAAWGGAKGLATDKLIPKISNTGKTYWGGVEGVRPTTFSGGFSGSYFRNDFLVPGILQTSQRTTNTIIANRTPAANNVAQATNRQNSTVPQGATRNVTSPSTQSGGGSTYTIRAGDTLSAISARTGISVSVLASSNNISNPNLIRAGATLSIPSRGSGGNSGSGSTSSGSRPGTTGTSPTSSGRR